MENDYLKTFTIKQNVPKFIDDLPVSKLLNYLTRDDIIELVGYDAFKQIQEKISQEAGKVTMPTIKKFLSTTPQFIDLLNNAEELKHKAYSKYVSATNKANTTNKKKNLP